MSNYDPTLFVNREKKFRGFQKLLEPETRQAVMVIEAPRDMGKSWLVNKMAHHCQEEGVRFPVAHLDFRHPREIHDIQDVLGLVRLLRRKLGDTPHFDHLNSVINSVTRTASGTGGYSTLRRTMERVFNLDDVRCIAFDLSLDFENLAGIASTKTPIIVSLIQECERMQRLPDLLNFCRELCPTEDWDRIIAADGGITAVSSPSSPVADQNGQIWADTEMERRHAERLINEAFFTCLTSLMNERGQVVFLLDSMEEAPDEAEQWLRQELLLRMREGQIPDIVVIATGRKTPDLTDLNIKHLLIQTDLDPFNEDHTREYIEDRRSISGLDIRTVVLTSGGVPGALAMMADNARGTVEDDDDFFSDL